LNLDLNMLYENVDPMVEGCHTSHSPRAGIGSKGIGGSDGGLRTRLTRTRRLRLQLIIW